MVSRKGRWHSRALWIFAVPVALWLVTLPVLSWLVPDETLPPLLLNADRGIGLRGQFGDAFGSINALFSGLAFAGVIVAILQQNESRDQQAKALDLQMEALKIQQKDLAVQIEEMKATRDEMKRHADTAERQRQALVRSAAITACAAKYQVAASDSQFNSTRDLGGGQYLNAVAQYGNLLKLLLEQSFEDIGDPRSGNARNAGLM